MTITPHGAKYYAHDLTRRAGTGMDWLSMALFDAAAGLNPHQIDASLFAIQSPLSKCVVLADEVGLGKTTEVGIVLGHFWAERERRLLVICPASIRKQWALELEEKFNLPQQVVDTKAYSHAGRRGRMPLGSHIVVVMSHCYANRLREELRTSAWDLVVIDEPHKLRNAYRPSNKVGPGIRWVTEDCRKRLLTATRRRTHSSSGPAYRRSSTGASSATSARSGLTTPAKAAISRPCGRGSQLCEPTLRNDVMEYTRYTERRAITRPFKPTDQEHSGYEAVPCFLQRKDRYALPHRQRHLTALILRKLLASSSQAIAATLDALRARLQTLREAQASSDPEFTAQLIRSDEFEDDLLVEILVETEVADQPETPQDTIDRHQPEERIEVRQRLATRARAIGIVAKARALLRVLEVGFEQMATTGGVVSHVISSVDSQNRSLDKRVENPG